MLIAVAEGARWSVYSRDIGRNRPVLPDALQWKYGERTISLDLQAEFPSSDICLLESFEDVLEDCRAFLLIHFRRIGAW